MKSTPEAEGYEETRQAFIKANEVADHTKARAELDRAIKAGDATYHAPELTNSVPRYISKFSLTAIPGLQERAIALYEFSCVSIHDVKLGHQIA